MPREEAVGQGGGPPLPLWRRVVTGKKLAVLAAALVASFKIHSLTEAVFHTRGFCPSPEEHLFAGGATAALVSLLFLGILVYDLKRLRLETVLRKSEARFRDLAGFLPQIVFETDTQGILTYANRVAFQISGYTPEDLKSGMNIIGLVADVERERASEVLRRGMDGETVGGVKFTARRKDGTSFPVLLYATPVLVVGRPVGVRGIAVDITERKRAEEQLRTLNENLENMVVERTASLECERERLALLLETLPLIVYTCRAEGDFGATYVSASVTGITGYDPERFLSEASFWADCIHPDDRERVFSELGALFERGVHVHEYRWRIADGSYRWFHDRMRLVAAPDGKPSCLVGVWLDVTDRKQTEEKLEQSLRTLQALIETTDTGYVIIDGEGKVLDANPEYVRLSGHGELREILGRSVVGWTAGYEREKNAAAVAQCVREGRIRNLEIDYSDGEGHVTPVEINASIVEADGVTRILSLCRDITARKQAEAELHRAKEAAVAANLAKSEFLSRVSHELRTPLNVILGFGQLLEMRLPQEEDRARAGRVLKAGRHLLALVDAILDLTRAEDGQLSLSPEPVLLPELVREAAALLRAQADQRNILLEIDAPTLEGLVVRADRERLKQVLLNLLANAVTYNRAGGRVTVGAEVAHAETVRLFVRDTGPGIPAAQQERLFRPFERLNVTPEREAGAGVGLALCRRLVEAMGGTIGLVSAEGEGSTFWVELPAAERLSSPPPPQGGETVAPGVEPKVPPLTKTLIYVEDNLANHALMRDIVAHRPGLTLLTAMQGRMALELALRHRPDLVLLDMHLPDINGDEVLRRLRERNETCGIPVVILSAESSSGQQRRLIAAGAQRCLSKPLDLPVFLSTLDELLAEPASDDRLKEG